MLFFIFQGFFYLGLDNVCFPLFVCMTPMNTTYFDLYRFDKVFEVSRKIQNACIGEILKRDRIVKDNKKSRKIIRCVFSVKRKINHSTNSTRTEPIK